MLAINDAQFESEVLKSPAASSALFWKKSAKPWETK